MAVKAIIKKTEFDALSDALKGEYKQVGEEYHLDVSGAGDLPAIKGAKDNENAKRKAAEARADAAETKVTELEAAGGDATKAVNAAVKPLQKQVDTLTTQLTNAQTFIKNDLVNTQALGLATEISKAPRLMLPHVRDRMQVDFDEDGVPTLRILGADKKPLAGGVDKLKEELVASPDFRDIIVASKASGGGAPAKPASGGGAPSNPQQNSDGTSKPIEALSNSELKARVAERIAARTANNAAT